MKMITVRDLRSRSAQIWRELPFNKELVITSNGKPVGILTNASPENLEKTLMALRRARAMLAVMEAQDQAAMKGLDKMALKEINAEISAVRKKRTGQ